MTLLAKSRARRLEPARRRREAEYAEGANWSRQERLDWQLARLNERWRELVERIPYYRKLVNDGAAPARFESWDSFVDRVPVTTKSTVRESGAEMSDPSRPPEYFRITGGSTAQPVRMPAWNSENEATQPDMWLGRSWYGVRPDSRLFLLWGHSHLLGSGLRGAVNARIRQTKDRALGYCRFSAYDLSRANMRRAVDAMRRFQPDYVIGYAVALDILARANEDRAGELRGLNLRAVIGTAESFPAEDSVDRLESLFGCPVAMEYGAVETHLIGHTHPDGGYRAFWRNYFIEATETGPNGGRILRVTSLYPRCFPLVRYELGDEIEVSRDEPDGFGVRRFQSVRGRCNAFVTLADGATVHSEVFTHCVKPTPAVRRYQVVQDGAAIELRLVVDGSPDPDSLKSEIRDRLARVNPQLESTRLRIVDELEQSTAGKTPMIIVRPPAS
ncbi:MAG: hypothetical protein ACF8PN_06430 [Phycisphaerales bacterium]